MIQEDAQRVLALDAQITALETAMHHVAQGQTKGSGMFLIAQPESLS